jgi:broad specificity phosphatase PhoE
MNPRAAKYVIFFAWELYDTCGTDNLARLMPQLILVKHAKPLVDPTKSSELWRLSDEGRAGAQKLADALATCNVSIVISSTEPKAIETAQILATALHIPTEPHDDLHEHDRSTVPHMRSGEFISHVELFFRRPGERVLGRESADEALQRFERAVEDVVANHPETNIAIVTHGTVIALFVEKHSDRNGFQVWREMSLPSFAVFDLPDKQLSELRSKI